MRRLHAVKLPLLYLRKFSGRFSIKVEERLPEVKEVISA
jgi:hypothetical protein